ncbi:probable E3 ubiquitin-protein ligase HECTD2 [Macaca thibetana thibetana]|uniref:probable E3 ubiquitin-protein ligase HECTD2 n=1 Tax=Macaca thibetana thibetana TaxID=257877 RepID=UPI0021BCCEDF|nr:probable E3 ubiquitin-protein ligase HECTD2 [Macaca thibetana thibetana]
MSEAGRVPSPATPLVVAAAAPEERKGKEPEREKLPPIVSAGAGATAGLDRGAKGQISTFSSFISAISPKKEAAENRSSPAHLVFPNIKNDNTIMNDSVHTLLCSSAGISIGYF